VCRVLGREYPPQASSVTEARHWARRTFRRWELAGDAIADAVLLTSELVTNAVLHARSPLKVSLAVADGVLEVGVSDAEPRTPRTPRRRTPEADGGHSRGEGKASSWLLAGEETREGGRGLMLVDELADEWGVASMVGGKQVWFRLMAGDDWPHRTTCPCSGEDLEQVRLESGRNVLAVRGPWDDQDDQDDKDEDAPADV
jgi:anti-sigma regulatory factor (Ser/Thr protein kinase)